MSEQVIKHGPFEWKRRDQHDCEVWELVRDSDLPMTYFVLKNYGGKPAPGFHGWKLVSGGPFDHVGCFASLQEALEGATPWLVNRYTEEAEALLHKANLMRDKVSNFTASLTA